MSNVGHEKLYTLRAAAKELAQRQCQSSGHDFRELCETGRDGPVYVFCVRCGKRWRIEAE